MKNAAGFHHLKKQGKGSVLFPCITRNLDVQVVGTVQDRLGSKQQFLECSYGRYVSIQLCLLFKRLEVNTYDDCSKPISPPWFRKTYLHVLQDFTVTVHLSEDRHSQACLQNRPPEIDTD